MWQFLIHKYRQCQFTDHMFEYIDKLRKSPEPVRHRFVIVFSVSIIAIIFIVWGVTLAFRIKSGDLIPNNGSSTDSATSGISETWKGFVDQVSQFMESSSETFESDYYTASSSVSSTSSEDATFSTSSAIIESI